MQSASSIADRIIHLANTQDGLVNDLSPLKLQKLLYYVHGWYAANRDVRLIAEDFQAWRYGPVVPSIYDRFLNLGAADLKHNPEAAVSVQPDADLDEDITAVLKVYGNMSPYELVSRTHEHRVWKESTKAYNKIMPFEDIKTTFKLKRFAIG